MGSWHRREQKMGDTSQCVVIVHATVDGPSIPCSPVAHWEQSWTVRNADSGPDPGNRREDLHLLFASSRYASTKSMACPAGMN